MTFVLARKVVETWDKTHVSTFDDLWPFTNGKWATFKSQKPEEPGAWITQRRLSWLFMIKLFKLLNRLIYVPLRSQHTTQIHWENAPDLQNRKVLHQRNHRPVCLFEPQMIASINWISLMSNIYNHNLHVLYIIQCYTCACQLMPDSWRGYSQCWYERAPLKT